MSIRYFLIVLLFSAGCAIDRHEGHIYIHDPNHIEVVFDRPMVMELERDGFKVKADSRQSGFFTDLLKFILLRPR